MSDFSEVMDRIKERKAKEGSGPDVSYTFTSKEAALIVGGLNLVKGFAASNLTLVEAAAGIFWLNRDAYEIANKLANQITEASCPAYITEEVEKWKAEQNKANQTDKSLS